VAAAAAGRCHGVCELGRETCHASVDKKSYSGAAGGKTRRREMWLVTRRSWTLIQRFDDGEQRDQLRRPGTGPGRAGETERRARSYVAVPSGRARKTANRTRAATPTTTSWTERLIAPRRAESRDSAPAQHLIITLMTSLLPGFCKLFAYAHCYSVALHVSVNSEQ